MLFTTAAWISYAAPQTAESISDYGRNDIASAAQLKPVAVIYFTGAGYRSDDSLDAIKTMIQESSRELSLSIKDYGLKDESELASTIDRIADGDTGFIIIIEPHDIPALMKIPGLYPDIHFSVVGVAQPLYLLNVNSMLFKEPEGTFLSGVVAALQSTSGTISFTSKEDTPYTRNLAYAYFQGAKYINPNIQVVQQLGARSMPPSAPPDIAYVQDDELLDTALQNAKKQKQLVIAPTAHLLGQSNILTGISRHYDLAMYAALRNYAGRKWAPVTENIGLGNGYIDFVVDGRNRALFSKDNIERTERTKDLVTQGIIKISTLAE